MTLTEIEQAGYEALINSWMPTHYLTRAALECYSRRSNMTVPLWNEISTSQAAAEAYYASLPEDERRSEAALILAGDGWSVRDVSYLRS